MNDPEVSAPAEGTPPPLSYRMVGDMAPLFEAMAKASLEFGPIQKDRHVKVVTREKGTYEFDYATLEEVLRCTTGPLARHGLRLWHFNCDAPDGARELHHMLSHASGAFLETVQVIRSKEGDGWQQFGSAVTYARRYQVQCILGVSAEHDDDGNAADGNQLADSRPRGPQRTPPAPQAKPPQKPQEAAPPPKAATPPPAPKPAPEPPQEPAKTKSEPPPVHAPDPNVETMSREQERAILEGFKAIGFMGANAGKLCTSFCRKIAGERWASTKSTMAVAQEVLDALGDPEVCNATAAAVRAEVG